MRKSLVLLASASLVATAFANTPVAGVTLQQTAAMRAAPVNIVSITRLSDGQVYYPSRNAGDGVALGGTVWFDNMTCETCPALDANGVGINVAYADTSVTPAQVACACYTSQCPDNDNNGQPDTVAFLFPKSPTGCAFPGGFEAPSNAGAGIPLPTDITWDDYSGTDDGDGVRTISLLEYVNITVNNNPDPGGADTFVTEVILFFDDAGTTFIDGIQVTFGMASDGTTDGYGPVTLDLSDLDPPFDVNAAGLVMFDWVNDITDGEGVPIGPTACGMGSMIAGGDVLNANCPSPDTLVTVGLKDAITWLAADAETGADGPPATVDENFDGEAGLSYLDILNTGQLINWGLVDNVTTPTSELAHDFVFRFTEGGGGGGCPVPGCDTDLDGDCAVGLGDLGALLSCYNQPAACNPAADFDNDGTIGLGDLGALLAQYNNNCN